MTDSGLPFIVQGEAIHSCLFKLRINPLSSRQITSIQHIN